MMSYTLGTLVDHLVNLPNLPFTSIADPAMVYIPPVINYLNSYSLTTNTNLTTQFQGFISYILPEQIFSNSLEDQNRLTMNSVEYIPEDGYTAINCQVNGSSDVCAYGATRFLGQGNFEIDYTNIETGAFWGFAYGYAQEVSFAYPLAFEMEPVGLAWVVARNHVVIEGDITVDLGFLITRGDRSVRTRAFAYIEGGTATEGVDYVSAGVRPGEGASNLRWRRTKNAPNNDLTVTILNDDELEADETIKIRVECEALENCYAPITVYTITILDDSDPVVCDELPAIANGRISYASDTGAPHSVATVATYNCDEGYKLTGPGNEMRTCRDNGDGSGGDFDGTTPTCELPGCPVSTYREVLSTGESACVPCPDNSISTTPNSRVCTCFRGYYRTELEGFNTPCTAPPSACQSLQVVEERTRANIITVLWERPEIIGRDDFYYNIFYSDDNQTFTQHNTRPFAKQDLLVDYSLSGLRPLTSYTLRVMAENGVSDQEERGARSCEVAGRTGDIRPTVPSRVLGVCSVVVWTAPTRTYGRVIGYDVNFMAPGLNNMTINKGRREMFHVIGNDEVPRSIRGDTQVRVRAKVSYADGEWSDLVPLGCLPQILP